MADLLVLPRLAQRACRIVQYSAKKLEHTGSAEKERVALVPMSTSKPPLPKGKGTKRSVQCTRSGGGRESR